MCHLWAKETKCAIQTKDLMLLCCMELQFAACLFPLLQVIALKMFLACADTWSGRAPRTKWCTSARTTRSRPLAVASRIAPPMR